MQQNTFFSLILIGFFVLVFSGCGGNPDNKYIKVEGTITHNGQVVEGATVTWVPVDSSGEAASGRTDASGKFVLTSSRATRGGTGVLPGEYRVFVSKRSVAPPDPDEEAYSQGRITYDELQQRRSVSVDRHVPPPTDLLPSKYNNRGRPILAATVQQGRSDPFNFDLTD